MHDMGDIGQDLCTMVALHSHSVLCLWLAGREGEGLGVGSRSAIVITLVNSGRCMICLHAVHGKSSILIHVYNKKHYLFHVVTFVSPSNIRVIKSVVNFSDAPRRLVGYLFCS